MALYESLALAYDELFPVNPATLSFIEGLDLPPTGRRPRLVDLGSATGGHALALAGRGWEAIGLEPSPSMNRIAREASAREGLAASFLEAGMEELDDRFAEASFELLLCLGNTLPHLPSVEALAGFLASARRVLAPGGRLLIQLLNYAKIGPGSFLPDLESPGYVFRRRYREAPPGEARLVFETELQVKGGEIYRDETLLLPLRPAELLAALGAAGFSRREAFAGWDSSPFREEASPFLIALATK